MELCYRETEFMRGRLHFVMRRHRFDSGRRDFAVRRNDLWEGDGVYDTPANKKNGHMARFFYAFTVYRLNFIFCPTLSPLFLASTPHMWKSILAPTLPSQSSSPGATSTRSKPMISLPLSPSLLKR